MQLHIDQNTQLKHVGYMTNCVHPRILYEALAKDFNRNAVVQSRFLGIQSNTSALSYAELDHSAKLRSSNPTGLAQDMIKLRELVPMKIFGGCCGTNQYHMREIAKRITKM